MNPHIPNQPLLDPYAPSPIRGGSNFTHDIRVRTMASEEKTSKAVFGEKNDTSKSTLHGRYEALFARVDAEVPKGMGMDPNSKSSKRLLEPMKGFTYEPTRIEFVREMNAALPKLHASEYVRAHAKRKKHHASHRNFLCILSQVQAEGEASAEARGGRVPGCEEGGGGGAELDPR